MLHSFTEKPFIINGIKSWIHCLECVVEGATQEIPDLHHSHDYIELLYALDTDGYVWLNGERCPFVTGDLIIVNSKVSHSLTFNRHSTHICIKFLPQILYADENSLFEFKYVFPFLSGESQQQVFHKDVLSDTNVHELVMEIMEEWECKKPAFELVIRSNILKIFTAIFRYWHQSNTYSGEAVIPDIVKNAVLYMETHFDSVTEDEVAKYCNVSYHYFSYIFKKIMGKSYSEYINLLRLQEAEKLLLSTNKSITEIAYTCGFSTASYFISKFKKHKNITPKQFRENTRPTSY